VSSPSCDFDAGSQEFGEIVGIEDLVLNRLGAINGERMGNLSLRILFFGKLGFWFLGEGGLGLVCGHYK
jgi:hypothetical protein